MLLLHYNCEALLAAGLPLNELIEQPSWGGRMIIDLKGLSEDAEWADKKVGQSYELAGASILIDPVSGESHLMSELIGEAPKAFLGEKVVEKFGGPGG